MDNIRVHRDGEDHAARDAGVRRVNGATLNKNEIQEIKCYALHQLDDFREKKCLNLIHYQHAYYSEMVRF